MKRTFILIAIAFFLVGGLAICDEATLIDFTLLSADISYNDPQFLEGRQPENIATKTVEL